MSDTAATVVSIIVTALGVFVGIVVLAMPFLVWGVHSEIKQISQRLSDLESELTELPEMAMALDSIQLNVEALAGEHTTPEVLAAMMEINRLRLEALKRRSDVLGLRLERKPSKQGPRDAFRTGSE